MHEPTGLSQAATATSMLIGTDHDATVPVAAERHTSQPPPWVDCDPRAHAHKPWLCCRGLLAVFRSMENRPTGTGDRALAETT